MAAMGSGNGGAHGAGRMGSRLDRKPPRTPGRNTAPFLASWSLPLSAHPLLPYERILGQPNYTGELRKIIFRTPGGTLPLHPCGEECN